MAEFNLQPQLSAIRFSLDIFPGALVRATRQIDDRVMIQFITPASSIVTVNLEQARNLHYELGLAIKEIMS